MMSMMRVMAVIVHNKNYEFCQFVGLLNPCYRKFSDKTEASTPPNIKLPQAMSCQNFPRTVKHMIIG